MESMSFYLVSESQELSLINLENLKDYSPYPLYSWQLKPVIALKHLYRKI